MQLNADGSSCLLTATGNKLRCPNDAQQGAGASPEGDAGSTLIDPTTLTNDQLKTLHEAIVKDLHDRIPAE